MSAGADGDGRYRDLLLGVGLGFLGGFLVLFLAADQVFSQRYMLGMRPSFVTPGLRKRAHRRAAGRVGVGRFPHGIAGTAAAGIMAGVLVNLSFGLLRMTYV